MRRYAQRLGPMIKQVLVTLLLSFLLPARLHAATTTLVQESGDPFEWYMCRTTTDTCSTQTGSEWVTALSCTIDRTSRTTNKTFIGIGHTTAYRENDGFYYITVRRDGVDQFQHDALAEVGSGTAEGSGMTKNYMQQETINAGTSTTFTWSIATWSTSCLTGGDTNDECCIDEAVLVFLEKTAAVQYATNTAGCGNTSDAFDAVKLTFTPASQEKYYLIYFDAVQMWNWSGNDSQYGGPKFENETDGVIYQNNEFGYPGPVSSANQSDKTTVGGVAVETIEASSHTFAVEYNCFNDASTNGCCTWQSAIAAFPVSYFTETFDGIESPTNGTDTFNNSGGTHPDVTQSVSHTSGRDYVGVMGFELSNEDSAQVGHGSFTNGTNPHNIRETSGKDGDSNNAYNPGFIVTFEKDAATGSRTWVPSFESDINGGPKEAITKRVRMWIGGKDAAN